ncbi:MAG: tetratricopeptide repeat protein [Myxococcota bacterium]
MFTHHPPTMLSPLVLIGLVALSTAVISCTSSPQPKNPYVIPDDDLTGIPGPQREVRALKILGRAQSAVIAGNAPEAMRLYKEALSIYASLNDHSAQAAIHNDLALLASNTGDYDAARELLEQALTLAAKGEEPTIEAEAHYNLGDVLYAQGDLTAAESTFTTTIERARTLNNAELLGLALNGRGNARRRQNNIVPAIDDYTAALVQWNILKRDDLAAVTLMNIGYGHVLRGEPDPAAQAFQEAIRRLEGAKPSKRAVLVPHLQELVRLVRRDPNAARERVLDILRK